MIKGCGPWYMSMIDLHRPTATASNHLHCMWSICTVQLHLPFTFHAIDPHHPTASTIYLSRDLLIHTIQLHLLAFTFHVIDRSTPSNCIYHFTFHVIDPHHPTASTIYIAPDPSTPSKLHLPFCMAPAGQSTPSKCINCFESHLDWSIDTVQLQSYLFCIVLHPNRGWS
jgi:hypothetical protein